MLFRGSLDQSRGHAKAFLLATKQILSIHVYAGNYGVVVVVITPLFPRDGGTAQTRIQVYAVNLIEIRLRKDGSPFLTSHEWLVAQPPRRTAIDGYS